MMMFSLMFGGIFSYEFKPIGLSVEMSDYLLSWASSCAALTQAVTSISVGFLYDKLGFKTIFIALMMINAANSLVAYSARYNDALFFACVQLNFMVFAGMFALFPTPVGKTFGDKYGVQVYSYVMLSSPLKSIISMFGIDYLEQKIGVQELLYTGTASSFMALIICLCFNEKLDIQRMERRSLLVWANRRAFNRFKTSQSKANTSIR